MARDTETRVHDILRQLRSLDKARELFAELNYDPLHDLVSRKGWGESVANTLAEDPQIIACHNDFKIIYARLNSDSLSLGDERSAINKLLKEYPYLLCLFSDKHQEQWHFINVKYDEEIKKRRLFRRITVGPGERLRTAIERLSMLDLERVRPDLVGIYPLDIQTCHDEAFDVEVVTREFYNTFVELFHQLKNEIAGNNPTYRDEAATEAQMILNRLLFLYFIQKKRWLDNNPHYLYERFQEYHAKDPAGHRFYSDFLLRLFQKLSNEQLEFKDLGDVPFLNGGLFEIEPFASKLPFDLKISNRAFRDVFENLLERFNFTVREDTPLDIEVAIDPEMLGRIFENLILQLERDRDLRKMTGSYYTPRVIVHFMCQQSLKEYLASEGRIDPTKLEMLLELNPPDQLEDWQVDLLKDIVSIAEAQTLRDLAKRVLVLDPAVGSGAFLVGMLHETLTLIKYMDVREHGPEYIARRNYDYELKRDIIENCLYGVDILEQAVRICELRLWLSLVVDYDRQPGEEVPPLPNLSYRVKQGDSLIETLFGQRVRLDTLARTEKGRQLIDEIQQEKHSYFLTQNLRQKRHKELGILVKQCALAEILVNEKKQYLATRPRLIGEMTAKEAMENEEIRQQASELDKLLSSAKNTKQKAQAWLNGKLSASSIDINKLRQQLGMSFVWRLDFAEVFKERDGFDIVIANPPYLSFGLRGAGKLSKADDSYLRANYQNSAEYKLSMYAIFINRGIELLGKNSVLCYITPDSFLLGRFFSKLRRYLLGIKFYQDGAVDAILLPEVDRETRNPLISVPILNLALDAGVPIFFAEEQLQLDPRDPDAIQKYTDAVAKSCTYLATMVRKCRGGRFDRANDDHKLPSNTQMFGFDIVDGRRMPNQAEATALVEAAQIALKEGRLGPAVNWLNEKGFRTTQGKLFTTVTLRGLFRNRAFIGETTINFKEKVVTLHHEPILDVATFEALQVMLDGHRRAQRSDVFYCLSGLNFCGCGARFEATKTGVGRYYYRCERHCGEQAWRRDSLEWEVNEAFSRYLEHREGQQAYLELA
jgi:hypothetical protein